MRERESERAERLRRREEIERRERVRRERESDTRITRVLAE